ncbi:type II secretion system F family protein [Arthrobacter sp. Soil782]|uniref:type II secretion system F family protein n=1 Tax=Arthrobacter sp. Soil782 TaxID=1736410 RepID=UPI0009E7EA97|nr:type II secretion system F family protein [Arthrobacter sp. Soil782]
MTGALIAATLFVACWVLHRSPPLSAHPASSLPGGALGSRDDGLDDPALMMDLMASMLAVGSSLERGLDVLARSASAPAGAALTSVKTALDLGASWDVAWAAVPHTKDVRAAQELGNALRFAGTTGAPSAAVVTAHATQFRRRRNREAEQRAAALGVRLVVPLGLCSLPAFVCLGVIPILVGLFPAFT